MGLLILLGILALPLAEIAVFIVVGDAIGVWPTLALVALAAVAGVAVVRRQGVATLANAQRAAAAGRPPAAALFDGLCILVAGFLLVVPGFVTDAIALALLLAPVRRVLGLLLWALLARHGTVIVGGGTTGRDAGKSGGGPTIDAEAWEVEPDAADPSRRLPDDRKDGRP
ncbi:MAG: FxsA family protein [Alphaproteobacteria bacterium]